MDMENVKIIGILIIAGLILGYPAYKLQKNKEQSQFAGVNTEYMVTDEGLECIKMKSERGLTLGISCNWEKFNKERGGSE